MGQILHGSAATTETAFNSVRTRFQQHYLLIRRA
jgi:hypothetical protein